MYKSLISLVFIVFFTINASASMQSDFYSMPDSILQNKTKAVVVKDSANYLSANLSSALTVEMKKLKMENGDSCYCMIKTYKAPEEQSTIEYYNKEWKKLSTQFFSLNDFVDCVANPIVKTLIDPVLISAHLSPSSDVMTLKVSTFMLSDDEKNEIKNFSLTKELTWKGTSFE